MFAEAKTKGFNLEDTRLTMAKKLSFLLGLVALAMAWAAETASAKLGTQKRPRKPHESCTGTPPLTVEAYGTIG